MRTCHMLMIFQVVGSERPVLHSSRRQAQPAFASSRLDLPPFLVVAQRPGLLRSQQALAAEAYLPAWQQLEGPVLQAIGPSAQRPLQQAP